MRDIRLAIGQSLFLGIIISFVLLLCGGILYLSQHYNDVVNFQNFSNAKNNWIILTNPRLLVTSFSPRMLIQLGLFVLLFMQLIRVGLTIWYFWKEKNALFVMISSGILLALIAALVCSC